MKIKNVFRIFKIFSKKHFCLLLATINRFRPNRQPFSKNNVIFLNFHKISPTRGQYFFFKKTSGQSRINRLLIFSNFCSFFSNFLSLFPHFFPLKSPSRSAIRKKIKIMKPKIVKIYRKNRRGPYVLKLLFYFFFNLYIFI